MENRTVGWLIIGISVVIVGIILLFNQAMLTIVEQGCPVEHSTDVCPAFDTIQEQTYLSLAIVAILFAVGIVLLFSKPSEKIVVRRVIEKQKRPSVDVRSLSADERAVLTLIEKERALFQADLGEKTGFAKVKITRILDKFESQGLIERKRRGMHNLVVLK
ncbi:MAG: MarR family transcriptional regulator [Nanoarchaeota archaeon]